MRIVLATALLLAATPAGAQEIDKTRIDVTDFNGRTICRFKALPDLKLDDLTANWEAEPIGLTGKQVTLRIRFLPIEDAKGDQIGSRVTTAAMTIFRARIGGAKVASARLVLDDGGPAVIDFNRSDAEDRYRFILPRAAVPRFAAAKRATATLHDAAGATLATFIWDVSPVRRAGPLLQAAEWRCRELTL